MLPSSYICRQKGYNEQPMASHVTLFIRHLITFNYQSNKQSPTPAIAIWADFTCGISKLQKSRFPGTSPGDKIDRKNQFKDFFPCLNPWQHDLIFRPIENINIFSCH